MPLSGDEVRRRDLQVRVVLGVACVLLALLVGGHFAGWEWTLWTIPLIVLDVFALSVAAALWGSREEDVPPLEWWRASFTDATASVRDKWRRGRLARVRLVVDVPWELLSWGSLWIAAHLVARWSEPRGA